jgi:hypothetical protein
MASTETDGVVLRAGMECEGHDTLVCMADLLLQQAPI